MSEPELSEEDKAGIRAAEKMLRMAREKLGRELNSEEIPAMMWVFAHGYAQMCLDVMVAGFKTGIDGLLSLYPKLSPEMAEKYKQDLCRIMMEAATSAWKEEDLK